MRTRKSRIQVSSHQPGTFTRQASNNHSSMNPRSPLPFMVALLLLTISARAEDFHAITCDGVYPRHLQGICTNDRDAIFWSWTDALVKTDTEGHILKQVPVASHHGDLCFHEGRVFVAVNLGKFNEPLGKADSWVYVYDADTLIVLAKHPVPELVHGAGGMACHGGKFLIVGGLPPDVNENLLYEYDEAFHFVKRHVLASGHTDMGIQTVTFSDGTWWFGCYGKPKILLRADEQFKLTGKWEFDASLGITPLTNGRFLIGKNTANKGVGNLGRLIIARSDEKTGLIQE